MRPEAKNHISRAVGKRVKQLRQALGLSQEKLAERTGLHRTYIGAVERGERNITVANLVLIANRLGIDAGQLITGISSGGKK